MTWSVSASGKKAAVKGQVEKQISGHPEVVTSLQSLVDTLSTNGASLSGSGSNSSFSISGTGIHVEE